MTFREARDIAEGNIAYDDHRIIRSAWQYLIDRHHIPRMDDWFQATAKELIKEGICWPASKQPYRDKRRNS